MFSHRNPGGYVKCRTNGYSGSSISDYLNKGRIKNEHEIRDSVLADGSEGLNSFLRYGIDDGMSLRGPAAIGDENLASFKLVAEAETFPRRGEDMGSAVLDGRELKF